MSLLDKLTWRYATKKFDENKKISPEQLNELLSAVQLAPSSAGLQAYRIIVVENSEIKQKLREAARGQQQLTTASHVIVFAAETILTVLLQPAVLTALILRLSKKTLRTILI